MKRPYIYLGLALAATGIVWLIEKPTAEKQGDVLRKSFFENLDTNQVAEIEIRYLLDGVKLKKEDGEWLVGGRGTTDQGSGTTDHGLRTRDQGSGTTDLGTQKWFRADDGKILMALDTLVDLDAISLEGKNPEKHGFFEVNAVGEQIKLLDKEGKTLAHFYVGKSGAAFMEGYVRKEGENEVYLANRFLRPIFPATVDAWRNHTLWDTASANITGIQIDREKNPLHFKKEEGKWKEPDAAKLVEKLSKVDAVGFAEALKPEMGLGKPSITVTIVTEAKTFVLKIGKENTAHQYYAMKGEDPQVYLLSTAFIKILDF